MIRFALHPGLVVSPNDGGLHWISGPQLARLYGVPLNECVVVDQLHPAQGIDVSRLLNLYPSSQGAAYWHISDVERRQYPLSDI